MLYKKVKVLWYNRHKQYGEGLYKDEKVFINTAINLKEDQEIFCIITEDINGGYVASKIKLNKTV